MLLFIYSIHLRHEFIHERFVIVNLWTIGVEFVSLSPFLLPRS